MPQINGQPDATTTSKGKIQLAGDLTGSSALPTLATTSIKLGYAQITSDFTTTSATTVQATGLSVTVTVPAGGRSVKITAWTNYLYNSTALHNARMSIWDGVVGSGTQISQASAYSINNGTGNQATAIAFFTPSAGSKTYNVGLQSDNTFTAGISAAATYPAFILVELI